MDTRPQRASLRRARSAGSAAIAGYFLDPARFFQSYLVGFLFSIFIPLGGTVLSDGDVSDRLGVERHDAPHRREHGGHAAARIDSCAFQCCSGSAHLYEWAHPDAVAHDSLLRAKQACLNPTSFTYRTVIYFLLWSLWATRIYKHSHEQDKTKSLDQMHAISRWSAPGLLMLVLSGTLASFDWSMSLDPHWYSTIFGLYCFAGGAFAFMALWLLILVALRDKGVLRNTVHIEHYHDLGKWMFALTIFWAYIAFSQYLLIWYANIPEETDLVPAPL